MSALCLVASGYPVPGFLGYYFYGSAKFLFQTGNKKYIRPIQFIADRRVKYWTKRTHRWW